jgi:hypothetical protein
MNPKLLIILGLPRSFTSVIGTMLGQHPQMYAVPELHLFRYEAVGEYLHGCSAASFRMGDGLRRVVAELVFGGQTEVNVSRADGWIRRRAHLTTGFLVEYLADIVRPSTLVEKSPSTVFALEFMYRALEAFPDARFLHLVRHPWGHGRSVMKYLEFHEKRGLVRTDHWLLRMAPQTDPAVSQSAGAYSAGDPQHAWYELNRTICDFLESVAPDHKLQVRGEDILSEPDTWIRKIAAWMQLRGDNDAVEQTKHPERSPYARLGPRNAMYGMDYLFLKDPALRAHRADPQSLDGPLPWRADGAGFAPYVIDLARRFGYR